jgi:hypothetical protein
MARSQFAFIPSLLDALLDGHVYTSGRMGSNQSKTRSLPKYIAPGTTRALLNSIAATVTKPTRGIPELRFRVLVIGRANAGKTSILQRVCDTTESPKIYREGEEVRSTNFV